MKYAVYVCGGSPEFYISNGGQSILFEDHPYCGPMPTDKRTGNGRDLAPNHWFWHAVTAWYAGGKRTEGKNAIWSTGDLPKRTPSRRDGSGTEGR